jgi:hypothetical protein
MNAALSSRTESSTTVKDMLQRCVKLRTDLLEHHPGQQGSTWRRYRAAAAKSHWKLAAFNDDMFTHHQSQHEEIKQQQAWLKQTEQGPQGAAGPVNLHEKSLKFIGQNNADKRQRRAEYLKAALNHYMHCIELDAGEGKFHGGIFRILHLWFENLEGSGDDDDEKGLRKEIATLLKQRFEETDDLSVFTGVARQVLSRLDDNAEKEAQQPMRVLLAKLLRQRPQELLLPTFYVATLEGKSEAANSLIQDLRRGAEFKELVQQTEQLKDAYIELAKTTWCKAQGHQPCNRGIRYSSVVRGRVRAYACTLTSGPMLVGQLLRACVHASKHVSAFACNLTCVHVCVHALFLRVRVRVRVVCVCLCVCVRAWNLGVSGQVQPC